MIDLRDSAAPGPAGPTPVRVLIVDDDRRVRHSLSGLIALREGVEVVGTAPDSVGALELVRAAGPDTILLDLCLPHAEDGLGLLARLHHDWPSICIVAMSVQVSLRSAALAAGATAFIPKAALRRPEEIGDALVALGMDARRGAY